MRGKRPKNEGFYRDFADRLKKLIGDRSLSEIAKGIHNMVSQKTLWDYVNGISMPGPDVLVKLSEFFHVSVDYLLKGQMSLFPKNNRETKHMEEMREAEALGVAEVISKYGRYIINEAKKEKEAAPDVQSKVAGDKAG